MATDNNGFEIPISFPLNKTGAKEAAAELDKLKASTTDAGKEGVKQQEAVEDATKKTFASQKQLKDLVKQVALEFPVVGAAGRLMMNPVVAATAATTLAISQLISKTEEAARSMGGWQLPDLSEDAVSRFERMAEAAKKFAASAPDIKSAATDLAKLIDLQNSFAKGAGMDLGTKPEEIKAQAYREVGDRLAARAQENAAAAGNINPNNKVLEKQGPKVLAALEAEKKRFEERLAFLDEDSTWKAKGFRYLWRYGLSSPDAARAQEQSGLDSVDSQIANLTAIGANRGRRLGLRDQAGRDATDAAAMYEQSASSSGAAASIAGSQFQKAAGGIDPTDIAGTLRAMVQLAVLFQQGQALVKQAMDAQEKSNADLLRKLNNNNQRP